MEDFHVYGDGEFQKRLWPSLKLAAKMEMTLK